MKLSNNHVRCTCCKYVRPDKKVSSRKWTAYECGNSRSEFFGYLLNINSEGEKLQWIAWSGCECGVFAERRDVV